MELEFIRNRITELRMKKGVSEYQMSLDLGHSRSYIQNIVSGRSLPSVQELLYICEYLGVSPSLFFSERTDNPILAQQICDSLNGLSDKDLIALITMIDRLKDK